MSSADTHAERAAAFQARREGAEKAEDARYDRLRAFMRKRATERGLRSEAAAAYADQASHRRADVLAFQAMERGEVSGWPEGAWHKIQGAIPRLPSRRFLLDAIERHLKPRREGEQRCQFDGAILLELRPPGKAGKKAAPLMVCPKCRGNGTLRVAGEIQRVIASMAPEPKPKRRRILGPKGQEL